MRSIEAWKLWSFRAKNWFILYSQIISHDKYCYHYTDTIMMADKNVTHHSQVIEMYKISFEYRTFFSPSMLTTEEKIIIIMSLCNWILDIVIVRIISWWREGGNTTWFVSYSIGTWNIILTYQTVDSWERRWLFRKLLHINSDD